MSSVLPGIVTFGIGMAITVAPLTAAVLGSVDDDLAGTGSGVNNAVARFAGLLAVAALPALAGIDTSGALADTLDAGYTNTIRISAAVTAIGGVAAALVVGRTAAVRPSSHPGVPLACSDASLADTPSGDPPSSSVASADSA